MVHLRVDILAEHLMVSQAGHVQGKCLARSFCMHVLEFGCMTVPSSWYRSRKQHSRPPFMESSVTASVLKALVVLLWCRGIMNGLDTREWDPATDRFLPQSARFDDAAEVAEAKAHAKAMLQRGQGLHEDPEVQLRHSVPLP